MCSRVRLETDLHLLISVLGGVLAALALPAQLLQFGLALLQTLPFALVFHLVFLQRSLCEAASTEQNSQWVVGGVKGLKTAVSQFLRVSTSVPALDSTDFYCSRKMHLHILETNYKDMKSESNLFD